MRKTSDEHLDGVAIAQLTWKAPTLAAAGASIVKAALGKDVVYPDEVDLSRIPQADRNTIGTAYRLLQRFGIVSRIGLFRRSDSPGAKGRTIFGYCIASRKLAEEFLRRNGHAVIPNQLPLL